jgi:hypothetical protein
MGAHSPASTPGRATHLAVAKAKAASALGDDNSGPASLASSPGIDDAELDLAEEFNRQIQKKYVKGKLLFSLSTKTAL